MGGAINLFLIFIAPSRPIAIICTYVGHTKSAVWRREQPQGCRKGAAASLAGSLASILVECSYLHFTWNKPVCEVRSCAGPVYIDVSEKLSLI